MWCAAGEAMTTSAAVRARTSCAAETARTSWMRATAIRTLSTAARGSEGAWVDRGDRTINVEDASVPEPRNVARGRPASASYWWGDSPPEFAVDGLGATGLWWGSNLAPQWIEVDLGRPRTIRRIELVVAQTPPGDTIHVIRGRDVRGNLHLLKVVTGYTADGMPVTVKPQRPWHRITGVRVTTVQSPSWVAWKEIRVLR